MHDRADQSDASPSNSTPRRRLTSLDAFRGLTVAGMILVNTPGSWDALLPPLRHAEWDGWTPTDQVFPAFLFIMGVAIPLAFASRRERGASVLSLLFKIVWRTLALVVLGLVLNGFPNYDLETLRYPGVLQRIGICYGLAALATLGLGRRGLVWLTALLLLGSWAIMMLVPAPSFVAGDLSKVGSIASYVDRVLMHGHLYKPEYDPEGVLSTIPALASTLLGVLAGLWIQSGRGPSEVLAGLMFSGFCCVLGGWIWSGFYPINKALWTSSFVLWTGGWSLQGLGLFYYLIEMKGWVRWSRPLVVFGINAIAAYVVAGLLSRCLGLWHPLGPDGPSCKEWIHQRVFLSWLQPPEIASFGFALSFVFVCWLLMSLLA